MGFISQLLKNKGSDVWSIGSQKSVYEALQELKAKDVGALLVIDDGKLVGIFSERDYARRMALEGKASKDTRVADLMSKKVFTVTPDTAINECMELMTQKKIRHLPVVEKDAVIGVITIGDVVKMIIFDKEFELNELKKYISGAGYGG
ncbi:MAG: CBS domain-containing protein [Candidatus Omnitrophota bacterium]